MEVISLYLGRRSSSVSRCTLLVLGVFLEHVSRNSMYVVVLVVGFVYLFRVIAIRDSAVSRALFFGLDWRFMKI